MSKYRIIEKIGEGGMGDVYRAVHDSLRREVAIKIVRDEKQDGPSLRRFEREIDACTKLNHPNIVKIYDSGKIDGRFYYSMELIKAPTLRQWMFHHGALEADLALSIMGQLLEALAYCHEKGFVHRDLKPANVMIDDSNHVTLMDFGLVKQENATVVTEAGKIVGTPRYLAPEVLTGQPAGAGVDVWAAGIIFFELLTARGPFRGDDMMTYMQSVLRDPAQLLSDCRQDLPGAYEQFVRRSLQKDPAQRFQDCVEMLAAFDHLRENHDDEAALAAFQQQYAELPSSRMKAESAAPAGPMIHARRLAPRRVAGLAMLALGVIVTSIMVARVREPAPRPGESPVAAATPAQAPVAVVPRVEALIGRLRDFDAPRLLGKLADEFFIPLEELALKDPKRDKLVTQWRRRLEVRIKEFDVAAALDELGRLAPSYFTDPSVAPADRFALLDELEKLASLGENAQYHGIPVEIDPLSAIPPGYATRIQEPRGGDPGRRTILFSFVKFDAERLPELTREDIADVHRDPKEESLYFAALGEVIGSIGQKIAANFHSKYPREKLVLPDLVSLPRGENLEYVDFVMMVKHIDAARYFLLELETEKGWVPIAHLRGPRDPKRTTLRNRLDRAYFMGEPMSFALRLAGSSPFRKPARVEAVGFQVKMKPGLAPGEMKLVPRPDQGKRKG